LLEAGPEGDVASKALVTAVLSQKPDISRLFLRHGASADFDGGASILAAVTSKNAGILKHLVGNPHHKQLFAIITAVFEATLTLKNRSSKQDILEIILAARVRKDSLNKALVTLIRANQPDSPTINALLKYGASVYYNRNESLWRQSARILKSSDHFFNIPMTTR
jgi:hypothetical protein